MPNKSTQWRVEKRCEVSTGVMIWAVEPTKLNELDGYMLTLTMEAVIDGKKKSTPVFMFPGKDKADLMRFFNEVMENLKEAHDKNLEPHMESFERAGLKCIERATEPIHFRLDRSLSGRRGNLSGKGRE